MKTEDLVELPEVIIRESDDIDASHPALYRVNLTLRRSILCTPPTVTPHLKPKAP
jgi:hypothetical protein